MTSMPTNQNWEMFIEPVFKVQEQGSTETKTGALAVMTAVTLLPEVIEGGLDPYTEAFISDVRAYLGALPQPYALERAEEVFASGDHVHTENIIRSCQLAYQHARTEINSNANNVGAL